MLVLKKLSIFYGIRKLPTKAQLDELKQQLAENADLPQQVLNTLKCIQLMKFIQWQHFVQLFLY